MTKWGRCKHVAQAQFTLNPNYPTPLYFKSDHSKRNAWKVVPKVVFDDAGLETWEMTLHHLPPSPGKIRLIDAVFTLANPNRKVENCQVGKHSVGNEWTEICKIRTENGEDDYYDLTFDVEVSYFVEKSMENEYEECGCKSANCPPPKVRSPSSKSPLSKPSPPEPPQPVLKLAKDFQKLFLSEASSDCVFVVGDEEIPAHKQILSARLPYFERLFASGMRESSANRVRIDDVDAALFKRVLNFVYSGQLPEDLDECPELYLPVAEKYDVRDFKDVCASALAKNLKIENVVDTLIMAHLFRCPSLKSEGIQVLSECKNSLSGDALEPLKSHPDLMLECLRNV